MSPISFIHKYGAPCAYDLINNRPVVEQGCEERIFYDTTEDHFILDNQPDTATRCLHSKTLVHVSSLRRIKEQVEMIFAFGGLRKATKAMNLEFSPFRKEVIKQAIAVFEEVRTYA